MLIINLLCVGNWFAVVLHSYCAGRQKGIGPYNNTPFVKPEQEPGNQLLQK